jgi:orotidine-5'-phosphate decarboxylase
LSSDFPSNLSPRERIVFPLDLSSAEEALRFVSLLSGTVGCFKVGLQLFSAEGPSIIRRIKDIAPDAKIFLDLKLHDIPATVGRAMDSISRLGVDLTTVHAQGGPEMLKAAVSRAGDVKVLAVTLLTSLAPAAMAELAPEYRAPGALTLHLAKRATATSCHGIVASSQEVALLRKTVGPDPILVIPGIRPSWVKVDGDDQMRTGTPGEAIANGATLLVIGRPIRDAEDPRKAASMIVEEISRGGAS